MFTLVPSEYRTLALSVNAALLFRVQQRKEDTCAGTQAICSNSDFNETEQFVVSA